MTSIGIDLGTTNSGVARYDPERGEARVVPNGQSEALTPSVVGLLRTDGSESLLVGRTALDRAARQLDGTVVSVKRLMGRDFTDAKVVRARANLAYEIVPGPDDDPRAHVALGDRNVTPAEISSAILRKLVEDASRSLGTQVTHAVITVPAYFGDAQRAATREAAELAGIVVKKIIDEPTAAAIAFGLDKRDGDRSRILVYDLGGGTFDISVLDSTRDRAGNAQFTVRRFAGDDWLGGDDFDLALVDRIAEWVRKNHAVDPSGDKKFQFTAKKFAEQAKRELNDASETVVFIPAAYRSDDGVVVDVDMPLTRADLREVTAPLVERTMRLVRDTLEQDNLSPEQITDVLLVGGGTLVRPVYEAVEACFGKEKVRRNINPMECVALGAGILAGTLHGVECPEADCRKLNEESDTACSACGTSLTNARAVGDIGLHEVTGDAMGVAAVRGSQRDVFVPIIRGGMAYPLPQPCTEVFQATDRQVIRVPVYEGNSPVASKNREQGVVELELPEPIDIGERVEVSFNYDANRNIRVTIAVPRMNFQQEAVPSREKPRTQPPAAPAEPDSATLRERLEYAKRDADRFLQRYGSYIDHLQEMKFRRDIEQAGQALLLGESGEYQRLTELLVDGMYHHCGHASQFLHAELAADGAPPDTARRINEALGYVKQAHAEGNRAHTDQQARNLANLVAQAYSARRVSALRDAERFGGILRVPDDAVDA
ncbi:Hsp70 family protein [Streptomyces europaeiscabiei]|uniref:Hsp70 family protein n=1 Tax=Streptomyces europaeiscabiei TaxID=146819 RepID=A0ABU4N744_9ACTN|nr:Hsp70 family protein [Streptomyces europaeiscabiei]MDX2523351.1 Hsp70 family protein [Streptomyces europaeiscabiei]MDX2761733.1 Hsp70 family protein [Streptomyces europaeiscabiei]MDX2770082.1 Hsp70 family protein [Streptomyces europaeiscabiei]MDX3542812.1 Hsp70 family protein [Streptomyces europaeiscabiei]MDX3550656.1 Hsp70 family protein [Streptomyces europaeiscabiei]